MAEQASIEELLGKHESEIKELKELVEKKAENLPLDKLSDASKEQDLFYTHVDDIFYLRYVLSKKAKHSLQDTVESVVQALEWRLSNLDKELPSGNIVDSKLAYRYTGDLEDGTPVAVLSLKQSDLKKLVKDNQTDLEEFMKYEKEKLYQMCDSRTRTKNKLVKSLTVVDAAGISLWAMKSVAKMKSLLSGSDGLKPHPQLQEATVIVNMNMAARSILKGQKKVEPLSVDALHKKYNAKDAVPSFVGGRAGWNLSGDTVRANVADNDSKLFYEQTAEWKLKRGHGYEWEFPVENPNSMLSFVFDTQSNKSVKVAASFEPLTPNGERRVFAPLYVQKQVVSYPLQQEPGKMTLRIENPGNKVVGKVKRRLKNKRASIGTFTARLESPENFSTAEKLLDNGGKNNKGLPKDFMQPVKKGAKTRKDRMSVREAARAQQKQPEEEEEEEDGFGLKSSDFETNKSESIEGHGNVERRESEDMDEYVSKFNIPEDSLGSWFKFLVPYVPESFTEAFIAQPTA